MGNEFAKIIRQYMTMRPKAAITERLFYQWRKGKCVNQVMGKNSITKIPKDVARFLDLPEPSSYTGHSYRRTATTLAANAGFSITELKRFGGWKSDRVCEGYIQNSLSYKRHVAKRMSDIINLPKSSSGDNPSSHAELDTNGVGDIFFGNASTTTEKSTLTVASLPASSAALLPIVDCTLTPTSAADRNKYNAPTSINFKSQSELTISSAGRTLNLAGITSATSSGNERNTIVYFGGTCTSVNVINLK